MKHTIDINLLFFLSVILLSRLSFKKELNECLPGFAPSSLISFCIKMLLENVVQLPAIGYMPNMLDI
jgi:hypothetical protein